MSAVPNLPDSIVAAANPSAEGYSSLDGLPNRTNGIKAQAAKPQSHGDPALITPSTHSTSSSFFQLLNTPVDHARPLRVIVIGAGFSGIYLGIRIPQRLRNVELVIYDKNPEVGGTWYENKYPGVACDVPCMSRPPLSLWFLGDHCNEDV